MPEFVVYDGLTGVVATEAEPQSLPAQSIYYVNQHVSAEAILIRTLLGTVTVEHARTGTSFRQSTNYSVLGPPACTAISKQDLDALLTTVDIDRAALNSHLRRNLAQSNFYAELLGETLHSMWRTQKGEHTMAFLHIYRLMERISFAFPLLYAARTLDFKSAFTELKKFIDSSEADHKFFRKFVETAIDPQQLASSSTFDFSIALPEYQAACFTTLRTFVAAGDIVSEVPDQQLEVKNAALLDLLMTLRNRFFHFSSQHPQNISCLKLPDPDALFECTNQCFLNWLAIIYFEVLAHYVTV